MFNTFLMLTQLAYSTQLSCTNETRLELVNLFTSDPVCTQFDIAKFKLDTIEVSYVEQSCTANCTQAIEHTLYRMVLSGCFDNLTGMTRHEMSLSIYADARDMCKDVPVEPTAPAPTSSVTNGTETPAPSPSPSVNGTETPTPTPSVNGTATPAPTTAAPTTAPTPAPTEDPDTGSAMALVPSVLGFLLMFV